MYAPVANLLLPWRATILLVSQDQCLAFALPDALLNLVFTGSLTNQQMEQLASADEHEVVVEVQVRTPWRFYDLVFSKGSILISLKLIFFLFFTCRNTMPITMLLIPTRGQLMFLFA